MQVGTKVDPTLRINFGLELSLAISSMDWCLIKRLCIKKGLHGIYKSNSLSALVYKIFGGIATSAQDLIRLLDITM